jgi:hypothetical protein
MSRNTVDLSRRRRVHLNEYEVVGMLDLPTGTRVLAVHGRIDPPGLVLVVANDAWDEVPPETEAPAVEKRATVSADGRLLVRLSGVDL